VFNVLPQPDAAGTAVTPYALQHRAKWLAKARQRSRREPQEEADIHMSPEGVDVAERRISHTRRGMAVVEKLANVRSANHAFAQTMSARTLATRHQAWKTKPRCWGLAQRHLGTA